MRFNRMTLAGAIGLAVVIGMWKSTDSSGTSPVVQKAKSDQTILVTDDDPAMAKAFAQGRATLPDFIQLMSRRPIGTSGFAVKIGVKTPTSTEYIWLNAPQISDTSLTGVVANTPEDTKEIAKGQTVTYPRSAIVDWTYRDFDRMRGNFTACALLTHEAPADRDDFIKHYKLDCSTIL